MAQGHKQECSDGEREGGVGGGERGQRGGKWGHPQ